MLMADPRPAGFQLGSEPTPEMIRHFAEKQMASTLTDVLHHRCGLPLYSRSRGLPLVDSTEPLLGISAGARHRLDYDLVVRAATAGIA